MWKMVRRHKYTLSSRVKTLVRPSFIIKEVTVKLESTEEPFPTLTAYYTQDFLGHQMSSAASHRLPTASPTLAICGSAGQKLISMLIAKINVF